MKCHHTYREPNSERIEHLEYEIFKLIAGFYRNESGVARAELQQEVSLALHFVMAAHIRNIECAACRRHAVTFIEQALPRLITNVLAQAAQEDADESVRRSVN
jgi:hypothetical protein